MRIKNTLKSLIPEPLLSRFTNGSERSKKAFKNIVISLIAKCVSVITPLLIVPLTISYVNPTQYGIWLTLSSMIAWISVFDLGLGHGFRNRFAESVAKGDDELARQYVSTTYFIISCIVLFLFICMMILNSFIDWTSVLKVESSYREELQKVVGIVCAFFCLNMVVRLFCTLLTANQEPGTAALVTGLGEICSLAAIFVLTKVSSGSLFNLALYYSGIPCLVLLVVSLIAFNFSKYKKYAPGIKHIKPALIKSILSIGIQFFFIQLCMIAIFQIINIVLSREIGPIAVTQYNVTHKYYGLLYTALYIIITPFWSAFTDAYTKQDYVWMKSTLNKLERMWVVTVFVGILMIIVSKFFFKIWLKDSVEIPMNLSIAMMFFLLSQALGNVYMLLINGIGTIRIQLIIYAVFALVSWPLLVLSCRLLGLFGILVVPSVVYLCQALLGKIQLKKLLNNTATGLWCK